MSVSCSVRCSNCGAEGFSVFEYTFERDNIVCTSCGLVVTDFDFKELIDSQFYEEVVEASGSVPTGCNDRKRDYKGSYNRRAYFMERFSAINCKDPEIPDEHKQCIKEEYKNFIKTGGYTGCKDFFTSKRHEQGLLNRRDVQKILHAIDKQRGDKYFSSHYMEKWKSITAFLLDREIPMLNPDEICDIGVLLMRCSRIWNEWQPPSRKETRETDWKYKDRQGFPAINFIIREIMKYLNIKGHDTDFPLPTTKSSLTKLQKYWKDIATTLELPIEFPKEYKQQTLTRFLGKRPSKSCDNNLKLKQQRSSV